MKILVRIAPEVNLKSRGVRRLFMRRLASNVRHALEFQSVPCKVVGYGGRLVVTTEHPDALARLARVFGVSSISAIEHECESLLEKILETAGKHYAQFAKDKTFAVRAKRAHVKGFTSLDLEKQIGALLYADSAGVNLSKPQVTLGVEARKDSTSFYSQKIPAAGGLPVGVQGRSLCLLSGGYDSVVAGWYMLKRGVALDYVFFNMAGRAYAAKVIDVATRLTANWGQGMSAHLHVIDFNEAVAELRAKVPAKHRQIILKRQMLAAANLLAETYSQKVDTLITGDAIGQVSTQTLTTLPLIDRKSKRTVLRPLLGFDKEEILQKIRTIGLFEMCEQMQEICNIADGQTAAQAKMEDVEALEAELDFSILERAVKTTQLQNLRTGVGPLTAGDSGHLFFKKLPDDSMRVIDVRHTDVISDWQYPGATHMTSDSILSGFQKWQRNQTYILYCPFGTESAVLAEKMQSAGFEAYSFWGGVRELRRLHQALQS